MTTLRIAGGRLIDPAQNLDRVCDLWIAHKKIAAVGEARGVVADKVIDARGRYVFPGLIDMHVHLREPGNEADETIATGTQAALSAGITSIVCMPDTEPALDSHGSVDFVKLQAIRARKCYIWPVGAVTKGRNGEELAEMGGMVQGGAVAFTDCDRPVANAEIMRRALEYSQMFDRPIFSHPEVPELTRGGLINEGVVSMKLGMPGMPSAAEEIMVDRDLKLAEWTGGRLHLQNLSCAGSVASVRRAKKSGIKVTAEVSQFHIALTESDVQTFDSNFKMNPPLRTRVDVDALIEGLKDCTIDALVSCHAPLAVEKKLRELDIAPFGAIGLETLLPISIKTLVEPGYLNWLELIAKLATNPARILKLNRGTLEVNRPADVTIFDPEPSWMIAATNFKSKSRNCPFNGVKVQGRTVCVFVDGEIRYQI